MVWTTTARFDEVISSSHFVATKVEVLEDDVVVADLSAPGLVVGGSVSGARAETQRSANLSIVDREGIYTPKDIDDLFMPSGRQVRIWRGCVFPDATPADAAAGTDRELVPLGTFRYVVVSSKYPTITLGEMYDRSWVVAGAGFENTYTIAKGTQVDGAIQSILWQAYPNVPLDLQSTDETTGLMAFDAGTNPWQVCQQLAGNIGYRLFFDPMGTGITRDEPDVEVDAAIWTFDDTSDHNFGLGRPEVVWQGQSYNAVIVVAENSNLATPFRSIAKDLDPKSPTKYGGLYGKRLAPIIRDEKITSQAQCDSRARRELQQQLGFFQEVTLDSLVIPQLEVGDVVYAADTIELTGAKYVLDGFDVPLRGTESMKLRLRQRQIEDLDLA